GGMDNPVNVAFLNNGERFLSCTFFQFPEAGFRDGLIHAVYGGVYGKKHDSIYAHPMTGDVMPVLNHQGAAAPCGLIAGSESLFGGGHDRDLYACYFNLHKVVRHELIADGPTYTTVDTDFLACDHPDFHPTDVFEDADGSLLVVDTGGWYKVCCPTSQLAKPDVLGSIYRIRPINHTGPNNSKSMLNPLGTDIAWDSVDAQALTGLLQDSRLFVRRHAAAVLRKLGEPAVNVLRDVLTNNSSAAFAVSPVLRRRAVWTLAGMEAPGASSAIAVALQDDDAEVRQAAAHATGLLRNSDALPALLKLLRDPHSGVARAAAEALGRLKSADTAAELLSAAERVPSSEPDASGAPATAAARIQEHALIYALMVTGNASGTRSGLASPNPAVVRATLVALDQMEQGTLTAADVLPHMNSSHLSLRRTAAWIVNHHPDWGTELTQYFSERLADVSRLSDAEREGLRESLSQLARSPEIQSLLLTTLRMPPAADSTTSPVVRLVLEVLVDTRLTSTPAEWLDALAELLSRPDMMDVLPAVVRAAQHLPQPKGGHPKLRHALAAVGRNPKLPAELRLNALDAAGPGQTVDTETSRLLLENLSPDQPPELRAIAATVLATAVLNDSQRAELLPALKHVGPMELPKLLPAWDREGSEEEGLKLMEALSNSAGFRGLRADLIRPLTAKYPESVQTASLPLLKLLNAGEEEQAAMLEALLATLPQGDIRRGHEVFMSRKAACHTCHKLGYGGGRLGPDLTTIGRVRNRRDLLEALMFPSASIVRGYEPVSAELQDGRVFSGIVTGETTDEIVISADAQKVVRINRKDVVGIYPSNVSPMPKGLSELLTHQEIADLLAFLQTDQR
ncbi:MAG: HEAT repeat domain-containing protein, partial [Planctomycetaceae bacterium]|nr:HEAT repeat domain-containing protein [Planctomycetaceae bacterium]